MQRRRVQVSLKFVQSCFGPILRLAAVDWLAGQQDDALLAPARCLGGKRFVVITAKVDNGAEAKEKLSMSFFFHPQPHSYLLQSVVELHGPEQEALLIPQSGADLLAHSSQLAALRPDGVLGIVGTVYQPVTFTGQGQGTV